MTAILKSGWGYYDVTDYPFGGCFRRASQDTCVEVIGDAHRPDQQRIQFPDGRLAVAPLAALNIGK